MGMLGEKSLFKPRTSFTMYSPRPAGRIRPKISTMPRRQSEASHYLDIYKLTVEKKRLQQELASLEQRQQRIQARLALLNTQIEDLEQGAQSLRENDNASAPHSVVYPPQQSAQPSAQGHRNGDDFTTVTLDY